MISVAVDVRLGCDAAGDAGGGAAAHPGQRGAGRGAVRAGGGAALLVPAGHRHPLRDPGRHQHRRKVPRQLYPGRQVRHPAHQTTTYSREYSQTIASPGKSEGLLDPNSFT